MRTEAWLYLLMKKCIQIRSEFHKSQSSQFQNWDKRNWNRCSTKIDLPTVLKHLIILFLECLAVLGDRSAKYWTEWNSNCQTMCIGVKSLTVFAKRFILNVWQDSEYTFDVSWWNFYVMKNFPFAAAHLLD